MERNFREEQDSHEDGSFCTKWRQPETARDLSIDALGIVGSKCPITMRIMTWFIVSVCCRANVASAS